MDWACILAYITGTVGQELLLRNEYPSCCRPIKRLAIFYNAMTSSPRRRASVQLIGEIREVLARIEAQH